jgi:aminodeoxyfutalosine deaminase
MAHAELHLHLEGSIEPETIQLLDPALTLEEIQARYEFDDFPGFIASFRWTAQRLRGPEDYALIARHLLQRLERQDILYAEITLAAGVVLWKEQDLAATWDAVRAESDRSPVDVFWNLDSIRQFGPELAMRVAEFAAAHVEEGAISIGIGGDEAAGPAHWFHDVYRFAKDRGLRLVAHAGETAGPESIWAALAIGAERIGHGIRAVDDPALMAHLRDRRIPCEVSIVSNVRTGAVSSLAEHPIRRLFDAGIPIVLGTDDPAIFHTTLAGEFALARDRFGFTDSELATIAENAWQFRFGATPRR